MNRAEQTKRFCSALFGGPDGSGDDRLTGFHTTAAWTLPDKRTRWAPADDAGAIASVMIEAAEQQTNTGGPKAVFFSAGLVSEVPRKGRAYNHDITALVALSLDIDVAGDGHSKTNLPPTFDAARSLVAEMGLTPSMVINSGGGLHAWWIFAEPVIFLGEDGELDKKLRNDVARLLKDWNSTARYRAKSGHGWGVDSTFELSRLMRVPGSLNCKLEGREPLEVRIVEDNPAARYELDDFVPYLADRSILDTYAAGFAAEGKIEALKGVNLHELWARVTSRDYRESRYTPGWLQEVLEIDAGGKFAQTWERNRPDLGNDQSSIDAAVVRMLHDFGVSTELQVEALMCARLRSGEKVDKVDPRRRVDYIAVTISKIQSLANQGKAARELIASASAAAAAGVIGSATRLQRTPQDEGEPLPPEPPEGEEPPPPGEDFGDYVAELIDHDAEEHADEFPARVVEAAREQVGEEHETPEHHREHPEIVPPVVSGPADEPESDDPAWGTRPDGLVTMMSILDDLLIPESYRQRGFCVWRIERRDHGEGQKGRLVIKVPVDYDWPTSNRPDTYKPGRPLFTDWWKMDAFATPRGFRMALARDAMVPAMPVGNRQSDWNTLIDALPPYWMRDTSGSDLKASATEWLLEYLLDHPAVTDKEEAVSRNFPLLVDHKEWGSQGAPVILFALSSYLAMVATKPGGPKGRDAKRLLDYLDTTQKRPRMSKGGKQVRMSWQEINPGQFTTTDWAAILEASYDNDLMRRNRRHLDLVREGGQTSRPSFRPDRRAGAR